MNQLALTLMILLSTTTTFADVRITNLQRAWEMGKQHIYPQCLAEKFTDFKLRELTNFLRAHPKLSMADALNPFLLSLGVSHTYIYDEDSLGYYVLRSMFSTKKLDSPKVTSIGAQLEPTENGLLVRSIFDGFPADLAGLQRGDLILRVNGKKALKDSIFYGMADQVITLDVVSNFGKSLKRLKLTPIHFSVHEAMFEAMKNSVRILDVGQKKIGYIHLWSGTDESFEKLLTKIMAEDFKDVDGVILDLRDGFGGAWWSYLDPFYGDRDSYFHATKFGRDGDVETLKPEPRSNQQYYAGPMAVLINRGVRSGKEALAYQFKKTNRATLFGSKTNGAFNGGFGGFVDEDLGFIFYLSAFELTLDGNKIEGVGVSPEVESLDSGANGIDETLRDATDFLANLE